MSEYIDRNLTVDGLKAELDVLSKNYEKVSGHTLLIYAADLSKGDFPIALDMQDYYIIDDILPEKDSRKELDVYLVTPGGSGEAAESIADLLHARYEEVNFVIAEEAKSAGTILALSGNNIAMTETGSLGPIDAQCHIGRGFVSADDYMTWIKEKMTAEALTPFDAMMVAQISPGELYGVQNSLEYAKDLVLKWLPQYKFKDWTETETSHKNVTDEMRKKRAKEIANDLTNHKKWRSHGRSLSIKELNDINLHIDEVTQPLLEIVKRIQVVIRLIFSMSSVYKIYSSRGQKIMKMASQIAAPISQPPVLQFEALCPKCRKKYKLYVEFEHIEDIVNDLEEQGFSKVPSDSKINCDCGHQIDLAPIKNEIEAKTNRKVL